METKFYKWWSRHRRVVTFGGFLVLIAWYLSPIIQESKYKNECIQLSQKGILESYKNNPLSEIDKSGLNNKELAKIRAYKNCNHTGQ
tara:strand:- start:72 stop:332 length:261 start_codon:yes stop_codon:yes gene_type:complete